MSEFTYRTLAKQEAKNRRQIIRLIVLGSAAAVTLMVIFPWLAIAFGAGALVFGLAFKSVAIVSGVRHLAFGVKASVKWHRANRQPARVQFILSDYATMPA